MLTIKKILVPVDFPNPSLRVLQEAATMARQFHSEMVLMHALVPLNHGSAKAEKTADFSAGDLLVALNREAEKNPDASQRPDLSGLAIRQIVIKDDPARAIVQAAQSEKVDLIVMPSHGSSFDQFLLGSVTAKVLNVTECPIWTGAHKKKESPAQKFVIQHILCLVELGPRSQQAVSWAEAMAATFNARLTLAHVTASVELWGPGGTYVVQKWKDQLVGDASRRIEKLQQSMGIKADVLIGSGDVAKVVSTAVHQTKADLLVSECYPYGSNLRVHGYAIICAVSIPVLSV